MLILLITEPGNDIMSKKYGQHGKLGVDGVVRSVLGFPRGEAVERSETDEERRNRPILYAVRKKGTICKVVRSYLPVFHIRRCRRSSSAPAGHLPPGGRYWPANLQFHDQLMKADSPNCLLCSSESFSSKEA